MAVELAARHDAAREPSPARPRRPRELDLLRPNEDADRARLGRRHVQRHRDLAEHRLDDALLEPTE
jgi:hypothetical protein